MTLRTRLERRNPWRYSRPRRSARWAEAEPGVRVEGDVTIGEGTRLMLGAQIKANGGPVRIGSGSLVARHAVIEAAGGSVTIGDRVSIGDFSNAWGQGGLVIGNDVLMSSGVRLITAEHTFDQPGPIYPQGERVARTVIEDGCWLGVNVVILAGVTVGAGAICAAGVVVRHDVEPGTIVGGVPARVIGKRPGF